MNELSTMPSIATRATGVPALFGRLREEIDQLFDDFSLPRSMRSVLHVANGMSFIPALELNDRKDHYELAVELPGIKDDDIDIEVSDGVLTLSGERRAELEERSGDCIISERSYGAFKRQLTLPRDADPDGIKARFHHGVLQIDIKKDEKAASRIRKIAIG